MSKYQSVYGYNTYQDPYIYEVAASQLVQKLSEFRAGETSAVAFSDIRRRFFEAPSLPLRSSRAIST